MKKRCIINVAAGGGWFPGGQRRLRESLIQQGFKGQFLDWDRFPSGCPSFAEAPYVFKSYAFTEARELGFTTILWLDAAFWAIRPLEPLFDHIEKEGHLFTYISGWSAGQWLKDDALKTLELTRDDAMTIPLFSGSLIGLDLQYERSQQWLDQFTKICQDGHTLAGKLHNTDQWASKDPRCLGHSHDQSVGSVIAHRLGMGLTLNSMWWSGPTNLPGPSILLFSRGGPV